MLVGLLLLIGAHVFADELGHSASSVDDSDYSSSAFSGYGEFQSWTDEESDVKFFQFGRFFGVSLGTGVQMLDGARGSLWQGGFPVVDVKIHYWFDFQLAMDLNYYSAQHYYDTTALGLGRVAINFNQIGMHLKYYFDTKNLSSTISFANPYVIAGFGSYSKTENSLVQQTQAPETSMGVSGGFGLEFVIQPRKTYFELETKIHAIIFQDTYTTNFTGVGLPNLAGNFYTVVGSVLLVW